MVLAGRSHRWLLTAEDGATTTGEFLPIELPWLGQQRLGGVDFLRAELVPAAAGGDRLLSP
ncbi:MAG: hypothetical protein IPL72_09105 [Sulfuritalea sp.]|nr:hypothetical protein [Sulfuritalea sp.]